MPTPAERQALLFIAAVAALGVGVRGCRALAGPPPVALSRDALAAQIARVDSAVSASGVRPRPAGRSRGAGDSTASGGDRVAPRRRPVGVSAAPTPTPTPTPARASASSPATAVAAGPIDLDIATAEELDRLPGIGPALAARIVEDRAVHGPFGSLAALERVRGIGPALAGRLRPHVTFSLPPRPHDTERPVTVRGRP